MPVTRGSRLGPYEILEPLGRGGMGEVYRAHDSRLRRDVAVKVLHPHLLDANHIERFQREARVLAVLGHPNVASVHDLDEAGGITFLVMELVEGETLAERLVTGPLPIPEVLAVARQVAAALDAVHEKGIVHRDLKPANIKLTPDGVVKVLDFGIAKTTPRFAPSQPDLPTATVATREGLVIGTDAYMSPEQARGQDVDRRTDVWAFGCVLFEMLTGRPAFAKATTADTIAAVIERDVDLSAIPPQAPPALQRLVRRCLQRDIRERLRDMGDARFDLEDLAWDPQVPAGGIPRRRIAAAAVGLLVLGGLSGALVTRARSTASDTAAPPAHFLLSLPPTTQLGALDFPSVAIAPDGSRLAYVANRGGQTQLYVRAMNALDAVPVAGTTNAVAPFFSPDSQWIAFFADGQLKKVALAGGAAITLCEAKVGLGGSWGRDDTIVFASTTGSGLSRVPASGGTPERVTTLDVAQGEFSHRWPQWLPDGTTVLYTAGTSGSFNDAAIVAHSLTSNRRSILVRGGTSPHYLPTGFLIYAQKGRIVRVPFDADSLAVTGPPVTVLDEVLQSSDGAVQLSVSQSGTLVFVESGSETGQPRLVSVARDGVSTPLAASPAPYASPRVSPDGRKLLVTLTSPTPDLWVYDMMAGTSSQLTFEAGAMSPVWSRDAKQVVFSSTRLGVPNLFTTSIVPGGPVERVIASGNQQVPGSWADDGTVVYAEQFAETGRDILLVSPRDRMPQPLVASRADETSPRFSHDGRWLAYVSNETGRNEVYVRPSTGQVRSRQISREGGTEPVWAPSGLDLFYREGDRMMSVAIQTSQNPSPRVLFVGDFARGTIDSPNYDVLPDGQFVMIQRPLQSPPQTLHVLINAFATLGGSSPR